jgi:SagB-type dehydrogenase family enzyme
VLAALAAAALLAGGCAHQAPSWVRAGDARYTQQLALPAPVTDGPMSLEQALERRRSARSFRPGPLPLATIGQLLWAGQGVTGPDGKRAAPSAGGRYPLELYVVTATEVMHYLPQGHRVEIRTGPDLRPALSTAALGQAAVADAPAVVVIAAVVDRTRAKYGARAEQLVDREAGHAAENILLEATARRLAAVPIGGFDPAPLAIALALPPNQTVRYLIPVGLSP